MKGPESQTGDAPVTRELEYDVAVVGGGTAGGTA